jgi:hypothetical protein
MMVTTTELLRCRRCQCIAFRLAGDLANTRLPLVGTDSSGVIVLANGELRLAREVWS